MTRDALGGDALGGDSPVDTADERLLCCSPLSAPDLGEHDAEQLASLLRVLGDPIRLRLVNLVSATGEQCACDLPAVLGRSQPTISHHLTQLVKAGILEREQRGKWAWFRLHADQLERVRDALG